ncbi:MAG: EAL domain-containing protein [Hoeflea sp.]|uniref:bifunctional diguanylate cyclase/phosphodiesterase n=1 Tax=Hoeflea sp. TaxID=1940281 RepID=UPI00273203E9|nr:EAL domain-containing protein [Hoeflea sp.]MDP2119573.1 EAL domain-containing protein [Hoeflea sp.]
MNERFSSSRRPRSAKKLEVVQMMLKETHQGNVDSPSASEVRSRIQVSAKKYKEIKNELCGYKDALNNNTIVSTTNRHGIITYANDQFCKISGYSGEELIKSKMSIVNSGYHPREFFVNMWATISSGRTWRDEICNRTKQGEIYWVDTTIVPRRNFLGKIDGYISIRHDITAHKQTEFELKIALERKKSATKLLQETINTISNDIIAFDAEDNLIQFSHTIGKFHIIEAKHFCKEVSFENLLRVSVENNLCMNLSEDLKEREAYIEHRLKQHRNPGHPIIQQWSDGRWIHIQERRSKAGFTVGVYTDISDIKKAEETIKIQAEKDSLTGLTNRNAFIGQLTRTLGDRKGAKPSGALILIDLDHFKDVNDTLGHDAGDRFLIEIGHRLSQVLRKTDTVARIGGDEFAVILPNINTIGEAEKTLEKIRSKLSKFITLGHRTIPPGCSMGVSFYPADGRTSKDLLKNADMALYQAKAEGRGIWSFFNPEMKRRVEQRQATADALREALANNEIEIAVQTQVEFQTNRHIGFEVLARWKHQGCYISPAEFIPVAEESGLIIPLGHAVLDQALAMVRTMRDKGIDPGRIAVNVAADQLKQQDFAQTVLSILEQYGLEAGVLEIEVTENVLLDRSGDQISSSLEDLHRQGVRIALDDFGTGHASLIHMKKFPVDCIKIDQSFVREIMTEFDDAIIVHAIINLAHNLGMNVVAEGIETQEQFDLLLQKGCDVAQGYLLGFPVAPHDALSFCAEPAEILPPTSAPRMKRAVSAETFLTG